LNSKNSRFLKQKKGTQYPVSRFYGSQELAAVNRVFPRRRSKSLEKVVGSIMKLNLQ